MPAFEIYCRRGNGNGVCLNEEAVEEKEIASRVERMGMGRSKSSWVSLRVADLTEERIQSTQRGWVGLGWVGLD